MLNLVIIYPIMTFIQSLEVLLLLHLVSSNYERKSMNERKDQQISLNALVGDNSDQSSEVSSDMMSKATSNAMTTQLDE